MPTLTEVSNPPVDPKVEIVEIVETFADAIKTSDEASLSQSRWLQKLIKMKFAINKKIYKKFTPGGKNILLSLRQETDNGIYYDELR